MSRSNNVEIAKIQAQEEAESLKSSHELDAQRREQELLERFKNQPHLLKWFEDHSSYMEGKIGTLFRKYKSGTLHRDALRAVYERFKGGDNWDKKDDQKLIEHLARGHFANFGKNFSIIVDAMEDKDDDVRTMALDFVRQKTIYGERKFIKRLLELKKSKLDPDTLTRQTQGALAIIEGGNTGISDETKEIVGQTDLGLLPQPPEKEAFPGLVRKLTAYLEESTKRLNEVDTLLAESKTLAESKQALRAKMDSDPNFAKQTLERLATDYDLLKRSAEALKKTANSPELLEALEEVNKARRIYQLEQDPSVLEHDETLHTKFLKAKEAEPVRNALLQAAQDSIQHGLIESVLEIEVERAVDEETFEAAEKQEEVDETRIANATNRIQTKYELPSPLLEQELLKKMKAASSSFLEHEKTNAESRSEYLRSAVKMNQWQGLCMEMADHVDIVQKKSGIKLVEQRDGWGVYPREVTLSYRDEDMKTMEARYDEATEGAKDPTTEFVKDKKGQVKFTRRQAKITKIEYVPQEYAPDETKAKQEAEERERWHPGTPRKGMLKITVERETLDGERKKDVMSQRDFLGWVASNGVYEDVSDPKQVEGMVKETLGCPINLKPGAVFVAESGYKSDPPKYELIEIERIEDGAAVLKLEDPKKPPIFRSINEYPYASSILGDETARKVPLGALYSWIVRRDMVQLGDDVDMSTLGQKEKAYWFNFGARGDGQWRWLKLDGTLGDLFEKHGEELFDGEPLTESQLEAFKKTPTFQERFFDEDGRHLVRRNVPGRRLMQMQDKYGLQDAHAGMPAPAIEEALRAHEQKAGSNAHAERAARAERANKKHEEREEQEEQGGHTEDEKKNYIRKEALPKSALGMDGQAHKTEVPYLKDLWRRTKFLASDDIWGLFKACYEHYERRWQRRSKDKFSTVGKGLPFGYGTEMNRIKQAAENEEVNQNMEAMENWGIWQVHHTLHSAANKDQLKACFQTLVKKGHMRWDDIEMWEKLNQFIPQGKMIPIPPHHNVNFVDPKTKKTGFDYLEGAIDFLWGEGQYQHWSSENNTTYKNKFKEYWEKGKQLEGDPKFTGTVNGELAMLLEKHKKGEYVDPHEYEGLIHFMIDCGKGNMEAKLYYIMEGVSIPNPITGGTILSIDRIGSINGDYLNRLPWMDYLTRRDVPRPDGSVTPWTLKDFKHWCDQWDAAAPAGKENEPNQAVINFIWENVLTDERAIIRNNKGLRNAQEMDHDDAHFIIPLADEELIDNICQNSSGSRRYFTTEGYANAYPGYNQYIKTLNENGEKAKVMNTIRGFARFNAIMSKRCYKDKTTYARMGPSFWNRPSVVDDRHIGWHKKQIEELTKKIAYTYASAPGGDELIKIVNLMQTDTNSKQKDLQKQIEDAIQDFGVVFQNVISTDGGAKMSAIISGFGLTGMPEYVSEEEKKMRKVMYAQKNELGAVFKDWHEEMN